MRTEIIEKISALITSAFGLVAALAWNSTIQSIFSRYYGQPGENITSQIIYAVIVTLTAVFATIWIGKAAEKAKKRDEQITAKLNAMRSEIYKMKQFRKKEK